MKKMHIITAIVAIGMLVILPKGNIFGAEVGQVNTAEIEAVKELIEDQLRNGNLDSEEDIKKAIDAAKENYGIEISDSEKEKAVKILDTVNELGIDKNNLVDIVEDVYDKAIDGKAYDNIDEMMDEIENQIIDSTTEKVKEVVKENVKNSISEYIRDFIDRIKGFWKKIQELWAK